MYSETLNHARVVSQDPVSRPPRLPRRLSFYGMVQTALSQYNQLRRAFFRPTPAYSKLKELQEVRQLASRPNDINEHLETMFVEALLFRPRLIVELGVRGGTSTFVFERAARLCAATVVSVDLEDCAAVSSYPRWYFCQGDDIRFADEFPHFCRERNITPSIDLLFVDTSHYYDHTLQEIQAWFPLLSPRVRVMFHDTNSKYVGPRKDGCFELAWNNERGVIRAIEEYLRISINEREAGVHYSNHWFVRHTPECNGFTILDRLASK